MRDDQISSIQYRVLAVIIAQGPISVPEIARQMAPYKTNFYRIINAMRRRGWIDHAYASDHRRRNVPFVATNQGLRAAQDHLDRWSAVVMTLSAALEQLSAEDEPSSQPPPKRPSDTPPPAAG